MAGKTEKATLLGGLAASFLASICCIGPVVFALLGLSGAGFIAAFEDYRPLFITVAVIFLGVSFYFTYKKKPAEECEDGSYCANPKSDKWNKIILWFSTIIIVIFIFFPTLSTLLI